MAFGMGTSLPSLLRYNVLDSVGPNIGGMVYIHK
jgi:hypothetical protein